MQKQKEETSSRRKSCLALTLHTLTLLQGWQTRGEREGKEAVAEGENKKETERDRTEE